MSEYKIIKTANGKVQGKKAVTFIEGVEYYSFRGIPFAQPPVGELRFKAPQKAKSWNGILDAFEYKSMCSQFDFATGAFGGSEDCLYVNVFVPVKAFNGEKLTTMLFIYGGAYQGGSASTYKPDFLLNQNVIVVTFGYRVGPLGFLSLGTKEFSGNMGLKDQRLAIQWVSENIEHFGGDKGKITLFGSSAGSSSAHFHVVIHEQKKLFQRVILQSGCVLNSWSYNTRKNDKSSLLEFAQANGDELIDFEKYLLNVDAEKFIKFTQTPSFPIGSARKIPHIFWAPTIENKDAVDPFFTEPIEKLANTNGHVNELDSFFGYCSREMTYFAGAEYLNEDLLKPFNEKFEVRLPLQRTTPDFDSKEYKAFTDRVRTFYFGKNGPVNKGSFTKYLDMLSDMWFAYGIDRSARLQVQQSSGKTYLFKFSMETPMDIMKSMSGMSEIPGASHGAELPYVFMFDLFPPYAKYYETIEKGSKEYERIQLMTKLWTNFAKYGKPDPSVKHIHGDIVNYVDIINDGIAPGIFPNGERVQFWDDLSSR